MKECSHCSKLIHDWALSCVFCRETASPVELLKDTAPGLEELPESSREAILLLTNHLAAGQIEIDQILPTLRELLGQTEGKTTATDLLDDLQPLAIPAVTKLRSKLIRDQLNHAGTVYDVRAFSSDGKLPHFPDLADVPLPRVDWLKQELKLDKLQRLVDLIRHRDFLENNSNELPKITSEIEKIYRTVTRTFFSQPEHRQYLLGDWQPDKGFDDLSEESRAIAEFVRNKLATGVTHALDKMSEPAGVELHEGILMDQVLREFAGSGPGHEWKKVLLDLVLTWPTDYVAGILPRLCTEDWSRERATLLLMLRFGKKLFTTWNDWEQWLVEEDQKRIKRIAEFKTFAHDHRDEFLLAWYEQQEQPDRKLLEGIRSRVRAKAESLSPEAFVEAWKDSLTEEEKSLILGLDIIPEVAAPAEAPLAAEPAPAEPEPPPQPAPAVKVEPVKEAAPAKGSLWQEHIQPFLYENWYMVVGLAMILVGASLSAYFTWDKHWLLRYTLMPAFLAIFTMSLSGVGGWLEKRFPVLKTTAVMLRGAAILLLPVNAMAVALLSKDATVTHKSIILPLLGAVYLGLFGWALYRWCGLVHKRLAGLQGWTLLLLNALIGLVPLCVLGAGSDTSHWGIILTAGFYTGFTLMIYSVGWFVLRTLTAGMLEQRRVPWFFGVTVGGTFLQVFAWTHWSLKLPPVISHYAIMVILAGATIIFMDNRFRGMQQNRQNYSLLFSGYALLFIGILMAMASPVMRIPALLLAGAAWLYQASMRDKTIHYQLGLTLLMLGGAAIGLLESFPKTPELNALPFLGLGIAITFRLLQFSARKFGQKQLEQATMEYLPGIFILTVVVSVLSQWYYRSDPLAIGGILLLASAFFAVRAQQQNRATWAYATMALLSLALPYLGCADMRGFAMHGNNMVFGLSILGILWLTFIYIRPRAPWLEARSTVLLSLGILALAAMLLRVVIEPSTITRAVEFREWLDHLGPVLITVVLALATFHSRSLIPAILAAIIGAVLFPELKAVLQEKIPIFNWGSGLGSATSSLVLVALCFPLPYWKALKNLSRGDLLMGESPFPLQRRDHTLFTWPLMATALFLAVKVETYNLYNNMSFDGIPIKTAVALAVTAATWQLLAAALRHKTFGLVAAQLTWVMLLLSFSFLNKHIFEDPQLQMPLLFTGIVIQCLFWLHLWLASRLSWVHDVMLKNLRAILTHGSWILAGVMAVAIIQGVILDKLIWLGAFLALQLIWHSLSTRSYIFGTILFALGLTFLAAWQSPGDGILLERLSLQQTFAPVLWLAIGIHLALLALELVPRVYEKLQPLMLPLLMGAELLLGLGVVVLVQQILYAHHIEITVLHQALLMALFILAARVHCSGEISLVALAAAYIFIQFGDILEMTSAPQRIQFLTSPWRLASLGLVSAILAEAGKYLYSWKPIILKSRLPLILPGQPGRRILFPFAGLLVCLATYYYIYNSTLRHETLQLWTPYLATATLLLVAVSWRSLLFTSLGGLALCVGNIQAVNIFLGEALLQNGLSHIHIICLGLVFTLMQGTIARILLSREIVTQRVNQGGVILSGTVLLLLVMNYFVHPNLDAVTIRRFFLSGVMAYAAGLFFRWAARQPDLKDESTADFYEGAYHFGVSLAIWCFVLMYPLFR
ncbi:hypothetical protein ACFL54_06060, partial [Planctomycetota bacterium]